MSIEFPSFSRSRAASDVNLPRHSLESLPEEDTPDASFSLRPITSSSPSQPNTSMLTEANLRRNSARGRKRSTFTPPPLSSSPPASRPSRRSRSSTPDTHVSASLVADVQTSRSRMLITKTHVLYPPPSNLAPYPRQAVLGFRIVYHPLSSTRIKDSDIRIKFLPVLDTNSTPIIKALYPDHRRIENSRPSTKVTRTRKISGSLALGFDPYGKLQLAASDQVEASYATHPNIQGSGIETNEALFTLVEDPNSHDGVEPSLELAMLLELPETEVLVFEAEVSVEATQSHSGIHEAIRRAIGSPRVWRLAFDGVSETGQMAVGASSSLPPRITMDFD